MDIQSSNSISLSIDDHKMIIIDADEEGFLKLDLKVDGVSILEAPTSVSASEARKFQLLLNSLNNARGAALS